MAQFSNCLSIISRMSKRDQDSLVTRLDELQAQGVPAEKAQIQAAIDVLMRAQADAAGIQRSAARDVTETPEFRRWFADSKVVDSDGKPLVVYHGGRAGLSEFKDPDGRYRTGIFFTSSNDMADAYGRGGETYAVYLSLQKPFVLDAKNAYYSEIPRPSQMDEFAVTETVDSDLIAEWALENGYDGVVLKNLIEGRGGEGDVYIASKGTQIKSAAGNNGQFDPNNADITRSASRQTETPAFKRWFGDSKAVDADGNPMVVYHGTQREFDEFDPSRGKDGQQAIFLTPNKAQAKRFAESAGYNERNARVMQLYVKLENPLVVSKRSHGKDYGYDGTYDANAFASIIEDAADAGHDGVIFKRVGDMGAVSDQYVAFRPEQIKSATGNSGAFDPSDPSIIRSVSRDTYAWRESIDTSVGPLLQGDGFYLLPQREITQDDFGDNGFAANGLMGHAERAVPGTRTIAYRIVGDNGIIGTLVSDVDPAGVLRSVHDIEITDRRGGIGSKVVATIAANTQSPIKIQDITDEADPFWTRIGVGYKDQYGDAFLDWDDVAQYLGTRRATQVDPDAAPAAGRGRGLQEGSYEVSELSPEEAADFFKFSKARSPSNIFGRDIAPAAIKAYKSLSPRAKGIIDGWNVNWSMGQDRLRESDYFDEVLKAYEPVREKLRQVYGDSIPAYRGETQDGKESGDDRFLFSWTPVRDVAAGFAINRWRGMPTEITQAQVDEQIANYRKSGIARLNGYKFVRKDPGKYTPDGPDYYYIYQRGEMQTDGDDIARALQSEKDERDEWIKTLRGSGKVYTAEIPVDSVAFIPVGANLRQPEFVAEYNPRKDDAQEIKFSLPRPAFYSQLQRSIDGVPDRLATMAAPQWKLWLDANASKLGIKKDEIEWSGIRDYLDLQGKAKVTREDLVAYLADSGVRVQEVVNLDDPAALKNWPGDKPLPANTKYSQYTVPGGENYREVLITLPDRVKAIDYNSKEFRDAAALQYGEKFVDQLSQYQRDLVAKKMQGTLGKYYRSSHWGNTPNILAHLRVDDRVDADGARVLFIGELQSDWGQQAKKDGVRSNYKAEDVELLPADDPESVQSEFFWYFKVPGNVLQIPKSKYATSAEARDYIVREKPVNPSGVPAAPFISDTKAWAGLALKRAIMMAVEEGHDKIAIITGEQAAGLYSLDKQISKVEYLPETNVLRAFDPNGRSVYDQETAPDKIEDVIGKEVAAKLLESEPYTSGSGKKVHRLEGVDLKVQAAGMRVFYDELVPQVARDVLKKLGGGQLQEVEIPDSNAGREVVAAQVPGESMWGVYDRQRGQWLSSWESETYTSDPDDAELTSEKTAKNMASAIMRDAGVMLKQPGFDITPAMREKVASGVPLFSKGRTTGDYGREYTPQQLAMFKNTGRTVEKQSLVARAKEVRKDIWKKMAQGIVDQFRPIKDLGGDAYTLARLSKGSSGAFEALLNYGKLSIVDGAYDADMSGGFIKTVGEPLGAELEDFAWWLASNRAELLSAEDRENLFTPEDIAAGKSLATGQMERDYVMLDGTVTRDRAKAYADSTKKFNAFNKNVLDIAEQSGLIDGESRQFWENEFYVPFYRVSDQDGEFMGAKIKGGLARQRAFQELKGGSQKLNSDLLANAMQNWAHLIDASAKNRAAKATLEAAERVGIAMESDQETVRQLGKSIGGKGGTVWFMDGGQQRHFLVGDPHLLVAINSLEYAGMRGPLMDALSTTKHWLTIGVTASPAFKVRNLIRDSLQAISVSDLSYNPLANLRDGIKASDRESQTYVSALASGGLIRFGTMLENNGAERVRRLVQKGVKPETILDSDDKLKAFYSRVIEPAVDAYNELGNRGEEINRAALFDQLKRQGMGQAEAALMARDLLDFSMQGTWTSIRFLTQVVPFLNARLQGLYVLGKGAAKNPQKFAITTGAVALAAISLLAAYHDDEDWKKREDWDRDTNFWFKIGGVAYRIPKPFEIGAIATLAERGVELFVNDEFTLKRFLERVKHIASDNLAMNPVPQAIKPMVDIYANKDSFSGRPIESMGMERLQAEYRYTANTSMVARAASTALNTVTRNTVGSDTFSPIQLDSLLRGYFGWLGTFIVAGADMAIRPLTNEPTRPQADYLKVVTQGIARQLPEPSSKYVSAVYDQAKILEQAYATHRQMVKEGKVEDAREFAEENREKLQRYKVVERVKQMQADINKRIREIERSEMSPEAKRDAIQKLREAQSRAAQLVY